MARRSRSKKLQKPRKQLDDTNGVFVKDISGIVYGYFYSDQNDKEYCINTVWVAKDKFSKTYDEAFAKDGIDVNKLFGTRGW